MASQSTPERPPSIVEQVLTPVLYVMFVLYPTVTNVAFQSFPCCTPLATVQTP